MTTRALRMMTGGLERIPIKLDQFGRCVVCVRFGWFRLNA
jgi:hypothetical protein